MNYTNLLEMPSYITSWLIADNYDHQSDPTFFSATSLMKPCKPHWLALRHSDEVSMDVSDLYAARRGSAHHDSFEKIETEGVLKEQRLYKEIVINDTTFTITGKFDVLELEEDKSWTLRDMKTTSVWAYIYGGKDKDYQEQLSIYRWLLSDLIEPINDISFIDFFFSDWQRSKAKQEADYPQHPIRHSYKIELLSLQDTEKFVINKVTKLWKYKDVEDDQLPHCTPEDLWAGEDKFACYKQGNKKATKLCDTQEEANKYMAEKQIKGFIQARPGKARRCSYCLGSSGGGGKPLCKQYQYMVQNNLVEID
jgi:hypothetical protein